MHAQAGPCILNLAGTVSVLLLQPWLHHVHECAAACRHRDCMHVHNSMHHVLLEMLCMQSSIHCPHMLPAPPVHNRLQQSEHTKRVLVLNSLLPVAALPCCCAPDYVSCQRCVYLHSCLTILPAPTPPSLSCVASNRMISLNHVARSSWSMASLTMATTT